MAGVSLADLAAVLGADTPEHGDAAFAAGVSALSGPKLPDAAPPIAHRFDFTLWPVGVPIPWLGATAPFGTLPLDGREVSQAAFPALFGICGTLWGAPAAAGNFVLPDWRERAPYGIGSKAEVNTVGKTDGGAVGARGPTHGHTPSLATTGSLSVAGTAVAATLAVSAHTHDTNAYTTLNELAGYGLTLTGTFQDRVKVTAATGDNTDPTTPTISGSGSAAVTGTPLTVTGTIGTGLADKPGFATCLWIVVAG